MDFKINVVFLYLTLLTAFVVNGHIEEDELSEPEMLDYQGFDEIQLDGETNAGGCTLKGLPLNTSPSNLYTIPPISDAVQSNRVVWQAEIEGNLNLTSVLSSGHHRSLSGSTSRDKKLYYLNSNIETKNFTRAFNTRYMLRYTVLNCLPNNERTIYYLRIPVVDLTPPTFLETRYTFSITTDWDRKRPISQGQFVIVGDNAFEIQTDPKFLKFSAIPENIIQWEAHPLWVDKYSEIYYYRLDIYLLDSVTLNSGDSFQVALSAKDEFNSAHTTINISVQ